MGSKVKYSFTVVEHRCDVDGLIVYERVQTAQDFGTLPKKKRFYAVGEAVVPLPAEVAQGRPARIREMYEVNLPAGSVQKAFDMAEGALKRELPNVVSRTRKRLQRDARAAVEAHKKQVILPGGGSPSGIIVPPGH